MQTSSGTAELPAPSMSDQAGKLGANDLPPEVLRSVGACLSCSDVLAARLTCSQWADALASLVTQLRVPVASHPTPAHLTQSNQSQQTPVAGPELSVAAQQLSAALARLSRVNSITLLLSPDTSSQDLQQALHAVGRKPGITSVYICEAASPYILVNRARGYACGLELRHLQHVTDLRLHTVALTLADTWQQLATLVDAPSNSSSCDADAAAGITDHGRRANNASIASINSSSSSSSLGSDASAADGQQPSTSNSSYVLRSLTIHQHLGSFADKVVCDLQRLQLPQHLTQLVTPLPGQYNTANEVVCPLNKSHQSYVQQLAAGLPFLQCLHITDVYEGDEEAFVGFKELQELHVELGGAYRSMASDLLSFDDDTEGLFFATQVGQLQRLELCPPAKPMAMRWQNAEGRMGRREPWRLSSPFKLEWLRQSTQLQHLSADLIQTGEDLSGLDGQLKSLSGRCFLESEELLRQVYAVGSALTSLELYHPTLDLEPGSRSFANPSRSIPVPLPASPLSDLVSLALIGTDKRVYTVKDPHALWEQLPALRCLKLQFVQFGPGRIVASAGESDSANEDTLLARLTVFDPIPNCAFKAWAGIPQLWISDLPCQQLQQLELAQYKLVVECSASCCFEQGRQGQGGAAAAHRPAGQQGAHSSAGSAASERQAGSSSSSQAAHNSGNSGGGKGLGCSLHGLRQLSLVGCTCWVAQPTGRAAGSRLEFDVKIGCPSDVLSLLLDPSGAASNLKCLELWDMHLGLSDMQLIMCSPMADHLEQLCVSQHWGYAKEPGVKDASAAVQQTYELDDLVAAAARDGRLQQLKAMCVIVPDPVCELDIESERIWGQGHIAVWGCIEQEQEPLTGGHCDCFRHLRQLHV